MPTREWRSFCWKRLLTPRHEVPRDRRLQVELEDAERGADAQVLPDERCRAVGLLGGPHRRRGVRRAARPPAGLGGPGRRRRSLQLLTHAMPLRQRQRLLGGARTFDVSTIDPSFLRPPDPGVVKKSRRKFF